MPLGARANGLAPVSLLTCLRRVILEKLGHGLLQGLIVLIRIFLKVNGLGGISTPDELLCCGVIQVYEQHTGGYGRSLARHCTAIPSTQSTPSAPRAATRAEARQVDALLLTNDR